MSLRAPLCPAWSPKAKLSKRPAQRARDATRAYLKNLKKDGMPVPTDKKPALDPVKKASRVPIPA